MLNIFIFVLMQVKTTNLEAADNALLAMKKLEWFRQLEKYKK